VILPVTPASAGSGVPDWWVTDAHGYENNSYRPDLEFSVCATTASRGIPATIDYSTSDGTATAGADYEATSGTLVFLPVGGESCQVVKVHILDDAADEWNGDYRGEWFHFDLSDPSVGSPPVDERGHARGWIRDDYDDRGGTIFGEDASVTEGGTLSFPIRVSVARSYAMSVHWQATPDSATTSDFTAASGDVIFQPGETAKYALVTTTDDSLSEHSETLKLVLSDNQPADRSWIYKSGRGTISDNDPLPRVSVADALVTAIAGHPTEARFTVSLSMPSGREVSVVYATRDGSARAPADYTASSGTLRFPAGVTARTVGVPVSTEHPDSGGPGTFALTLTTPDGADLDRSEAVATVAVGPGDPSEVEPPDAGLAPAPRDRPVPGAAGSARRATRIGGRGSTAVDLAASGLVVGNAVGSRPQAVESDTQPVGPRSRSAATPAGADVVDEVGGAGPTPRDPVGHQDVQDELRLRTQDILSRADMAGMLGLGAAGLGLTLVVPRRRRLTQTLATLWNPDADR